MKAAVTVRSKKPRTTCPGKASPDGSLLKAVSIVRNEKGRILHKKPLARRPPTAAGTVEREEDLDVPPYIELFAKPLKPVAMSIRTAREILGVGNTTIWRLIGQGRLETIRLFSKRLVLYSSIEQLIEELREKGGQ
jgi:hypothetical protein